MLLARWLCIVSTGTVALEHFGRIGRMCTGHLAPRPYGRVSLPRAAESVCDVGWCVGGACGAVGIVSVDFLTARHQILAEI